MIVSVIIPFYYGNDYICGLLEILNNNYKELEFFKEANMEVIIVNDSPNEEVKYNKNDYEVPIIVLQNEKNCGIHKTRNHGLDNCNGDYVLFLDQDDIISDNYIYSQLSKIGDADFIVSNGYIKNECGEIEIYQNTIHQEKSVDINSSFYYSNMIVSPGQVLIKSSSIPKEWKDYCFVNNGADDHYLWILMLLNGKKAKINRDKFYTHMYTGNNASLNKQNMLKSNLELVERLEGKVDKKLLNALKRRVIYYGKNESIIRKVLYFDVVFKRHVYKKSLHLN